MPRITHIINETYTEEDSEGLQDRHFAILEDGTKFEIDPRDRNIVFRFFENRDDDFDPERDLNRRSHATIVAAKTDDVEAEVEAEIERSRKVAPAGVKVRR